MAASGPAFADADCIQDGDPAKGTLIELDLSTGERLKGVYGGCKGVAVLVNHSLLGLLVIPRSDLDAMAAGSLPAPVAPVAPVPVVVPDEADETLDVEAESAVTEAAAEEIGDQGTAVDTEEEEPEVSPWTVVLDVGLDGTQGNSNDFFGKAGTKADWKSDRREFRSSLSYKLDMNGQHIDEQTADLNLRHDWLFSDSRWRWWASNGWLYSSDEAWDVRGILGTGPGYQIIKNDRTDLLGRTGIGISREFGGDDDDVHPEWVIGYDWSHKLTDHWKLVWNSTYFQKIDDGEFRFVTEANADYKFSNDHDIALRFGIKEMYNSDPDDGDSHDDFSYWLSLVFGL